MIYFYLMGEVFLVRFRKRLSFELLFSTTVFAVVSVFTLVLHIAFPGFRFQFFGMAMCVLLYLISSERPQEYTVPELEIMNRRAFLKESEERLLGSERFPMLVIKVHNLKVMRQTLGNDSVNEFLKEMAAFFRKLIDNSRIYQFSQSVYVLALDRKKKDIDSSLLIRQILDRFEQPWHSGSVETKFRIHISSIVQLLWRILNLLYHRAFAGKCQKTFFGLRTPIKYATLYPTKLKNTYLPLLIWILSIHRGDGEENNHGIIISEYQRRPVRRYCVPGHFTGACGRWRSVYACQYPCS